MDGEDEASAITPQMINSIFKCMVDATKSSNDLPKIGDNYELYASYPIFAEFLNNEGDRVLELMTRVYRFADAKSIFTNTEVLDELCENLEKANDVVSERLANCIDEAEGRRKQDDLMLVGKEQDQGKYKFINTSWNKRLHLLHESTTVVGSSESSDKISSSSTDNSSSVYNVKTALLLASKNVVRPQIQFQHEIDNSNRPFASKLKFKHNSKERPKSHMKMLVDNVEVDEMLENTDISESVNPYRYELDHFEPNSWQMEESSCLSIPTDTDKTELQLIETENQLDKLVEILKNCSEFAIDLEHHSYRSFLGLTCLMQISTRDCDYIVDTLKLWRNVNQLNDPFTDCKILKILHGADQDIRWLQRDFGVYLVNVFDTGQAMRVLGMPRFSLAYLIKHYFNKDLDKQFQMADWRIRPLPPQLIRYAREDTHYLLHCYDRLKNDLLENGNENKNLLLSVYERSRDLCLNHYEKPLLYDDDYLTFLTNSKKTFNSRQKMALKYLYSWRDKTARLEDESLHYVLPNHMLMQIAEVLPREMHGVMACCNPVPPLVRRELQELHRIVLQARESPLETISKTSTQALPVRQVRTALGVRPHDFTHSSENEDIIPLFQRMASIISISGVCGKQPSPKQRRGVASTNNLHKTEPSWFVLLNDIADDACGHSSTEPSDTDKQKSVKKKSKRNRSTIDNDKNDNYTTPYEMYLKAKLAQDTCQAPDIGSRDIDSGENKKRKLYSHLTPADAVETSKTVVVESEEITNIDFWKNKNGTDEDEDLFAEPPEKKKKKRRKNVVHVDDVKPFDYESAASAAALNTFEENSLRQKNSNTKQDKKRFFDPDGDFLAKGKGQKKKKFGGRPSKTSFFKSSKKSGGAKMKKIKI